MTGKSTGVTFQKSPSPNPSEYHVYHDGTMIGSVSRFQMGAAQFGATWMATAPGGQTSTRFSSRTEAATWLVRQSGR